jgi:hypothetical protein
VNGSLLVSIIPHSICIKASHQASMFSLCFSPSLLSLSSSVLTMARGKSKTSAKERVCSEEFIVEDEAQSDVAPSDEYIELDSSDELVSHIYFPILIN